MKKILIILMLLASIMVTGCFSSNEEEVKPKEVSEVKGDVFEALMQIVKSYNTRSGIPNATNGVLSGVYLSVGGTVYFYSFESIADINGKAGGTAFLTQWTSATDASSYIILGDSAITLIDAKAAVTAGHLFFGTANSPAPTAVDGSFAIQPATVLKVMPAFLTTSHIENGGVTPGCAETGDKIVINFGTEMDPSSVPGIVHIEMNNNGDPNAWINIATDEMGMGDYLMQIYVKNSSYVSDGGNWAHFPATSTWSNGNKTLTFIFMPEDHGASLLPGNLETTLNITRDFWNTNNLKTKNGQLLDETAVNTTTLGRF